MRSSMRNLRFNSQLLSNIYTEQAPITTFNVWLHCNTQATLFLFVVKCHTNKTYAEVQNKAARFLKPYTDGQKTHLHILV
jgi:hypothetical protein